jgi:flagellar biosynthesis/type III secretory pathway ATPase
MLPARPPDDRVGPRVSTRSITDSLSTLATTLKVGVFTGAGRGAAELLLTTLALNSTLTSW